MVLGGLAQHAGYLAIRGVSSSVVAAGPERAMRWARAAGRAFAGAPFNARRLRRAEANLRAAFPGWDDERVARHAVHSYEHMFSLGVEMALAPRLFSIDGWTRHIEVAPSISEAVRRLLEGGPCLLITGHVGNWELVGYWVALLGFPVHALYRPLDIAPLDAWVRQVRGRRGLILVDKFGAMRQLPAVLDAGLPVAIVADQNGGDRGMFVPYFNRLASTYKSIGLLAMQHNARIMVGGARRVEPTPGDHRPGREIRYRVELADSFGPEDWSTHPDPLFYLSARCRRGLEAMVRASPEQYDWIHRVWRSRPLHERQNKPFPPALLEKLRLLPWITDADIGAIIEHSARDAAELARTGQSKLS